MQKLWITPITTHYHTTTKNFSGCQPHTTLLPVGKSRSSKLFGRLRGQGSAGSLENTVAGLFPRLARKHFYRMV